MTKTNRIEFHIERTPGRQRRMADGSFLVLSADRYVLRDRDGSLHVDAEFESVEAAADMAHRFAQDNDLLPAFYFPR